MAGPRASAKSTQDFVPIAEVRDGVVVLKDGGLRAVLLASSINFALNAVSGAGWVSFHHGGGVGMGYSLHAGQVCVADGSPEAAERLSRVLLNDPGTGVMRHADAGYEKALQVARERDLDLPGVD